MAHKPQTHTDGMTLHTVLSACGYGLFLAFYYSCAQWGPSSVANAIPVYDFFQPVMRWSIVCGYAGGLVWGLSRPAGVGKSLRAGASIASVLGVALLGLLAHELLTTPAIACITAILLGISAAALNACWIDALRALSRRGIQTALAASVILVGVLNCASAWLDTGNHAGVILIVLTAELIVSLALLTWLANMGSAVAPQPRATNAGMSVASTLRYIPILSALVPVMICNLVVPLLQPMAGMMLAEQNLDAFSHGLVWCAGEIVAGCALLVIWNVRGPQTGTADIFVLCMPVIVTVAALFPFLGDSYWPLLFGFSEVLRVLMLVSAMDACLEATSPERANASPVVPYCLLALLMFLADLVACALGPLVVAVTPTLSDRMRLAGLLIAFVLACLLLMALFKRRGCLTPHGNAREEMPQVSPSPAARQTADAPASPTVSGEAATPELSLSCQRIAAAFGLSLREAEVLALQARGRNVPFIAEELGISQATVRSYVKRIHQVLDVHTQQELIDFVETH